MVCRVFYKKAPVVTGRPHAPAEMRDYIKGEGVKGMMNERIKDKEIRAKIISDEMAKLKEQIKIEASFFPSSTTQEVHNQE
jgi:hypothetical protein